MKKFLGATKVLMLMVVVMVLSGCISHVKLTDTAFNFKNAQNPDVVFIIEDKHFRDFYAFDIPVVEISSLNEISKAINTVFHDKAVAIYPHDKADGATINRGKIVKITPVEYNLYVPVGFSIRGYFFADVSINGETKRIEARSSRGRPFVGGKAAMKDLSNKLFLDFAQKIREELKMQ